MKRLYVKYDMRRLPHNVNGSAHTRWISSSHSHLTLQVLPRRHLIFTYDICMELCKQHTRIPIHINKAKYHLKVVIHVTSNGKIKEDSEEVDKVRHYVQLATEPNDREKH